MKCHLSSGSSRHNLSRLRMETLQHKQLSFTDRAEHVVKHIALTGAHKFAMWYRIKRLFSPFLHTAKRRCNSGTRTQADAEGKHYPEFTHSPAVPAGLRAAPWSLPMGFSIIHQCLHYSLYLLAPGKCSLSWVARGQYTTNTPACGHRKGFKSKVLPLRRHASRVVSAIAGLYTPQGKT